MLEDACKVCRRAAAYITPFRVCPFTSHAGLSEADKAELLAKWDRADGECCVCMDAPGADVAVLTRCGHGPMCRECIEGHLQSQVHNTYEK